MPSVLIDNAAKRDWEWKSKYQNIKQLLKYFSTEMVNLHIKYSSQNNDNFLNHK